MQTQINHNHVIPVVCLLMTAYFVFHTIQGNHGYKRMVQVQQEIAIAEKIKQDAVDIKNRLQTKVNALSPKSLDMDQLEESALRILNMGNPDSKIIFH